MLHRRLELRNIEAQVSVHFPSQTKTQESKRWVVSFVRKFHPVVAFFLRNGNRYWSKGYCNWLFGTRRFGIVRIPFWFENRFHRLQCLFQTNWISSGPKCSGKHAACFFYYHVVLNLVSMMSYPCKFQLSQDYVEVLPTCLTGILQIHREDGDDFEKYTLWLYYSNKQYCWYWFERGSIEIVCADSFFCAACSFVGRKG